MLPFSLQFVQSNYGQLSEIRTLRPKMSVSDTKLLSLENFIQEISLFLPLETFSSMRISGTKKLTLLFHVSMWIYKNIYYCKDNETIVDILEIVVKKKNNYFCSLFNRC